MSVMMGIFGAMVILYAVMAVIYEKLIRKNPKSIWQILKEI